MSYMPCDEGIYKKMYCEPEDRLFISGMEYLIDESISSYRDNCMDGSCAEELVDMLEDGDDETDDKLISRLGEQSDIVSFTRSDFEHLLKLYKNGIVDDIEKWFEMERGECLISTVEAKIENLPEKDIQELCKRSEKTDYSDDCHPSKNNDFVFNSNGKPRPRWDKGLFEDDK